MRAGRSPPRTMRTVMVLAGEVLLCITTVSPLGCTNTAEVKTQAAAVRAALNSSRWLGSVIKRDNSGMHEKCSVCSAGRGYTFGNKQRPLQCARCPCHRSFHAGFGEWVWNCQWDRVKCHHTFKQRCRVTALAEMRLHASVSMLS